MSGGESTRGATEEADSDGWRRVFGHAEPYAAQEEGIELLRSTARDDGYVCLEGACGTGKTMLALTAGVDLVRDPETEFERVLVLTSVKQQLRQFEADVRTINDDPPDDEPVSALTLVGKADVCPYSRENAAGIDDRNVYDRCEGLRDRTRGLTGEGGETSAGALAEEARRAQTGIADTGNDRTPFLETAGEPTPYLPETSEHYADGTDPTAGDANGTEYCPFYAQYLEDSGHADDDPAGAVPFDTEGLGVVDTPELVRLAAGHGSCPHSVMGALATEVEVVVGNYYHAFDPTTAGAFTGGLIDEETFLVCDEAHMLEPRVRDLVSDGVGDTTLRDAEGELTRVIQPVAFEDEGKEAAGSTDADLVRGELDDAGVELDDLRRLREFVRDLREELDDRVRRHLDAVHPEWTDADPEELESYEVPLRDPETPAEDAISQWARQAGYDDRVWSRAAAVGAVVERVLDEAEDEDRQRAAPTVGRVVTAWFQFDHESYFREIELEPTFDETGAPDSWRRQYNARLALQNCVPADAIGERLAEFGGGVLMSATLAPTDVFREVTGLDYLEDAGRPVVEETFGLSFPPDNRASFAVDAPKFTYENRGPPGDPEGNRARQAHVDAVVDVVETTPGNVLVGMPSYGEAAWIADVLGERVDRPVLSDESSSDAATEALKGEFFDGEAKVLATSIRGTLTEGVDYRGDRLAAAVICGVPIVSTASPAVSAVRTAYDTQFSRDGFETALTVPAVRKARQAIGRVIRGPEEVGVRVLVDARYARESWNSVRGLFPTAAREEFRTVSPDMLQFGLERFWDGQG
ncbi:ATP-dependent DNA helicase [Halobaculum sp. MBLA0143]|uniref:ATP-dependent DNA helicase n=1 Tax=Halobaculum sp. MBLA0143 TaxID=3079933 RepID=UPI003525C415